MAFPKQDSSKDRLETSNKSLETSMLIALLGLCFKKNSDRLQLQNTMDAVSISHWLESLGISLGNKTGTKLQLHQVVFVFPR